MAVYFEWLVCAAAKAHGRGLKVAYGRIEVDGTHSAQVRRGRHRQLVACGVGVAVARYNRQRYRRAVLEPAFAICHLCDFAKSHAVHNGDGQPSHTTLILHIENRTVDIHAVGVGAVKHHKLLAVFGGGVHEVYHRAVVGVVPQTDVLNVDHNDVNAVHHLGRREAGAAIEAYDGQAGLGVDAACNVLAGIGSAAEAVFGCKEGGYVDAVVEQNVESVTVADHTGVIGKEAYALALESRRVDIGACCANGDFGLDCTCANYGQKANQHNF